jgi:hypothetical protein
MALRDLPRPPGAPHWLGQPDGRAFFKSHIVYCCDWPPLFAGGVSGTRSFLLTHHLAAFALQMVELQRVFPEFHYYDPILDGSMYASMSAVIAERPNYERLALIAEECRYMAVTDQDERRRRFWREQEGYLAAFIRRGSEK